MIQAVPTLAASTTADVKSAAEQTKLKSAAQAFEAVFLRQMIGSMRDANLGDGMFDNEGTETFQAQADSQTADSMAHKGVLGIADMLLKQLGPIAEGAHGALASTAATAKAAEATSVSDRASALVMVKGVGA